MWTSQHGSAAKVACPLAHPRTACQPAACAAVRPRHNRRSAQAPARRRPLRRAWLGAQLPGGCGNGTGALARASRWLENSAEQEVDVPLERVYPMWEDRTRIPQWMPWISSVQLVPGDPRLSKWTLSTEQFGRTWEFSWLAENLTPIRQQKIHWRSVQGSTGGSLGSGIDVNNRGQIRFYRKSPTSCAVKLTISYEVPDVLAPFATALTPIVEGIMSRDLGRFADIARREVAEQRV